MRQSGISAEYSPYRSMAVNAKYLEKVILGNSRDIVK